jgi:hypothetical protein
MCVMPSHFRGLQETRDTKSPLSGRAILLDAENELYASATSGRHVVDKVLLVSSCSRHYNEEKLSRVPQFCPDDTNTVGAWARLKITERPTMPGPRHLQTGKPIKKFGRMRRRKILGNWLLCRVIWNKRVLLERSRFPRPRRR